MEVKVRLHGPLRAGGGPASQSLAFELRDSATAGDLLEALAARLGGPFEEALAQPALPSGLRLFVGSEPIARRDQPLAAPGAKPSEIVVVVLSPMAGG